MNLDNSKNIGAAFRQAINSPTADSFNALVGTFTPLAQAFEISAADNLKSELSFVPGLQSPGLQAALEEWVVDILRYLDDNMPENGPIGHDKRHLAKDAAAGLSCNDNDDPVLHVAAIPTLLHDLGRLVEAAFYGVLPYSETAPHHALFSFAIASQFACNPYFQDIPKIVSDHILHAVLEHTRSQTPTDMLEVVRSADREQLVGPEGVARLVAVQTAFGLPLLHPRLAQRAIMPRDMISEDFDAFHAVEFYLRYLYPQFSPLAQGITDDLKVDSLVFLLLALPKKYKRQAFAPERRCEASRDWANIEGEKKIIPQGIWRRAKQRVEDICALPSVDSGDGLGLVLDFMYHAPGAASHSYGVEAFRNSYHKLSPGIQKRLVRAYKYLRDKRREHDEKDRIVLNASNGRPQYVNAIAQWALRYI